MIEAAFTIEHLCWRTPNNDLIGGGILAGPNEACAVVGRNLVLREVWTCPPSTDVVPVCVVSRRPPNTFVP